MILFFTFFEITVPFLRMAESRRKRKTLSYGEKYEIINKLPEGDLKGKVVGLAKELGIKGVEEPNGHIFGVFIYAIYNHKLNIQYILNIIYSLCTFKSIDHFSDIDGVGGVCAI